MSIRISTFARSVLVLLACLLLVWLVEANRKNAGSNEFETQFAVNPHFTGQIFITIIERMSGPEQRREFMIDLNRGQISVSNNRHDFQVPRSLGGHLDDRACETKLKIKAATSNAVAWCTKQGDSYSVWIQDPSLPSSTREWSYENGWAIRGLTWAPDSNALVTLLDRERTDFTPMGLLAMASGHPIPLVTFKITLISKDFQDRLDFPPLRKDAPSGWARVDWMSLTPEGNPMERTYPRNSALSVPNKDQLR
jgi:hypothetical protein